MNVRQFSGEEITEKIEEFITYAKQLPIKERMILVDCLRNEANNQPNDIVSITLLKLAVYIESLEVEE